MNIKRTASMLTAVAGLALGGCASFQPSPVAMKNQVEPVMRVEGAAMSADRYYQAGRSAMRAGDLRAARKYFSLALLQDPDYIDAINGMAAILTVQGRYGDSLELMRQAVERAPDNEMFRRNLDRVEKLAARESLLASGAAPASAPPAPAPAEPPAASASPAPVEPPTALAEAPAALAEPRAPASTTAAVVAVAPNVYQLQLPGYSLAAAPDAARSGPISGIAAAGAAGSQASPTTALSAAWIRANARSAASSPAQPATPSTAAGSGPAAAAAPTPVSYQRELQAPGEVRIMVTNGMGREGWAARHAGLLGAMGLNPARITNHRHFGVKHTVIRYRAGMRSEAERITEAVPTLAGAELVADDRLPRGIDLQVLLGKDSEPQRRAPAV